MPDLSETARCVLKILEDGDSFTTTEILELARTEKYSSICTGCAGGDAFDAAANQLVELKLIKKRFGKGGYSWQLVKD